MCDPRTSCVRKLGASFLFGWKILVKKFFGIDESGYYKSSYSGTLLFMGHLHSGDRKFGPGKMFI